MSKEVRKSADQEHLTPAAVAALLSAKQESAYGTAGLDPTRKSLQVVKMEPVRMSRMHVHSL